MFTVLICTPQNMCSHFNASALALCQNIYLRHFITTRRFESMISPGIKNVHIRKTKIQLYLLTSMNNEFNT